MTDSLPKMRTRLLIFRFLRLLLTRPLLLLIKFIALQFVRIFELFAVPVVLLDDVFVYSSDFREDPR